MAVATILAEAVCGVSYDDLPEEVVQQAKRCIIDWFGVALGGSDDPVVGIMRDYVQQIGGHNQATILGSGVKTSVVNAALVNGAMSHVLDFDDTHQGSLVHPSSPLIPAILAVSEWKRRSGKQFICAYVAGYELEVKIGALLNPRSIKAGWHPTSVFGRLGAAAGVGKLLDLNEKEMTHALGIAATQSAGLRKVFGSMSKSFHPGKAAADGLSSCLLAKKGFTSSESIFESDTGFLSVFSSNIHQEETLRIEIAAEFEILNNCFKPYAACLLAHPTIEAACNVRSKIEGRWEDIEEVLCQVSPLALDAAGKNRPRTGLEGKFSLYFCAALSLLKGQANQSQFTRGHVADPIIKKIMAKIDVQSNHEFSITQASIRVVLYDGTIHEHEVNRPKGYPDNPMTDEELEEKFMDLVFSWMGQKKAQRLFKRVQRLEDMKDVSEIVGLCNR